MVKEVSLLNVEKIFLRKNGVINLKFKYPIPLKRAKEIISNYSYKVAIFK